MAGADRVGTGTPTRRGRASRSQTRSGAARIRSPRRRAASCGETDCQWYEAVARDKAANELHPIKTPPPRYPVAAEQSGQDGRVMFDFIVAIGSASVGERGGPYVEISVGCVHLKKKQQRPYKK